MNKSLKIIGLVLSGGKSIRMGSDKGLVRYNDLTLVEYAYQKIGRSNIPAFVSINKDQKEPYRKIFKSKDLIIDSQEIEGPLSGILSAHVKYPESDIHVLACDLVMMNREILSESFKYYSTYSEYDTYVHRNPQGEFEPLTGIYTSKFLKKVCLEFNCGKLEKHSMKYIIEKSNYLEISISKRNMKYFKNYNTLADLNDIQPR